VVPGIAAFLDRHPRVQADLLLLDRVVSLVEEGIDVAVRIAPLEDSGLVARTVGQIRRVLCASPALLERAGRPRHPRELARFECLRGRDGAWRFRERGRSVRVTPRGRFHSNHVAAALEACTAGVGIGSFLSYQVAERVRAGALEVLLPECEPEPVPVSLVHTHARLAPARVRALIEVLAPALAARLARI